MNTEIMIEKEEKGTKKAVVTDSFGKYAQEGKTSYKLGTNKIVSYKLMPSGMIHKKEETDKKVKEKKFPYSEAKKDMNKILDEIMEKTKPKNETPEQYEERLHRRRWGIPHPKNQVGRGYKEIVANADKLKREKKDISSVSEKKSIDEKTTDLIKSVWDELREQDRAKRSKVKSEQQKQRNRLNEAVRSGKARPPVGSSEYLTEKKDISSVSEKKSIDDKTVEYLAKSNKQIADAVRVVRLHKEGMHKEANKIASDVEPEYVYEAARKYNSMNAAKMRESKKSIDERVCDLFKAGEYGDEKIHITDVPDSILHPDDLKKKREIEKRIFPDQKEGKSTPKSLSFSGMKEKSNFINWKLGDGIVKGGRILPIGPGGRVQDLSKEDDEERKTEDQGAE